jgi:hypothetical protein
MIDRTLGEDRVENGITASRGEGTPRECHYQVISHQSLQMDEVPLDVVRPQWQSLTWFDLDAANNDVAY